jgi:tRNA A37 threonylcarbamoyltransferase TsaD
MAPPELCTDNAAMIASAAYFKISSGHTKKPGPLKIQPQLRIPSA